MPDQGSISGGYDTTRVSAAASDEEAQQRLADAVVNRRKLATLTVREFGGIATLEADPARARLAAIEFARRCDALGLDPSAEATPGICRRPVCTTEISLRAQHRSHEYERRGFCSLRCMRLSYLPRAKDVK